MCCTAVEISQIAMEANEIRDKIIRTAQQKMIEVGIRSVSIDDICREMGMSKKTFYVYFGSKDELIVAILDVHYDEVRERMQGFIDSKQSMWDVIRIGAEYLAGNRGEHRFPPFIYDLNKYYHALAKEYNARIFALNTQVMRSVVERCVVEQIFRQELNVELTALMLAQLHDNVVHAGIEQEEGGESFRQLPDFTLDVVLRGLFSREGLNKYEEILRKVKGEK